MADTYVDETFRYDVNSKRFSEAPPAGWCNCGHRITSHDGPCKAWLRYPDVLTARACGCPEPQTMIPGPYIRPDGLTIEQYEALTPDQQAEANQSLRDEKESQ